MTSQHFIARACAEVGTNRHEFIETRGNKQMWHARFAVYLAMRERGMSFGQIGRRLNRDHTTVHQGVVRARHLLATDPEFRYLFRKVAA